MPKITRREALKSGLAAVGASMLPPALVRALPAPADEELPGQMDGATVAPAAAPATRERLLFDANWRFRLGATDAPTPPPDDDDHELLKAGDLFAASSPKFDDSGWTAVTLPHDWGVDLPFVDDPRLTSWGFKPLYHAYPETSIGWYRKVFPLPASDAGRTIALELDGVFRDATVALNGHLLGRNASGYAPARYDIRDVATFGGDNVLVVRVDATEHEGWFYEGAGIYRHVWLVKTSPVHVAPGGTYVTTTLARGRAALRIITEVDNDTDRVVECRVLGRVVDGAGRLVGATRAATLQIAPRSRGTVQQQAGVASPALWSPDTPHLYTLITTVQTGGATVDRHETPFGIRTVAFDAERGFLLNGERVELRGTCNHQDHAGVGAALPDRLQYYRIARLKEMGVNAYRTSHNPPTPELLDACDGLGMLVLDETRMFSSSEEGLGQLERMIRRDRNRPCVIAWSIANEEWHDQGNDRGARIAAAMRRLVRRLDPSRPVTAAMDGSWGKGISTVVDVQGLNYHLRDIDGYRQTHPRMPVFGTEVASTVSTRGIYQNDKERGYVSAYDVNFPPWASTAEAWWGLYHARPWLGGGFVWTGFDYRGEPTPYRWPCISSHFGILDTCGFPKDNFYYYQARWTDAPVLHLFPHWNWAGREGQEIEVWCHTNLDRVELLLDGRSFGTRDLPRDGHVAWKVPYAPGTLEARGFRGAQQLLVARRETTGAPARLDLAADRPQIAADGEDVSMITARVLDAQGRVVPVAMNEITFRVSGSGRLLGVGNGDPSSHESDRGPTRHAFNGLCAAIVQSSPAPGVLHVEATAAGLSPASIQVTCTPAPVRLGA